MTNGLMTYMTKCMVDIILETMSIKHKTANFKKHLPVVVLNSKNIVLPSILC